jgi:hypothetical protein
MDIKLKCHVTSPALWMRAALYTENISRSGLLIVWRGEESFLPTPCEGQIITIDVELPANHGFEQKCIHCQGTITRVMQTHPDCPRVAMRVNYMDFRALHDRLRTMESSVPVAKSWMA